MQQNRTMDPRSGLPPIRSGLMTGLMLAFLAAGGRAAPAENWTTYYENSGCQATPRYAETVDFCRRLAAASPVFRYLGFGTSPQGRELPLLVVDRAQQRLILGDQALPHHFHRGPHQRRGVHLTVTGL